MKSTKTTVKATVKKTLKKAVKKDENVRTEIVFILDRSGSMSGREQDVIGGFNRMIDDQQKKRGECHVSTVLFNDVSAVLHNRVPISKVRSLTDTEYFVGGVRPITMPKGAESGITFPSSATFPRTSVPRRFCLWS